MLIVMFIACYGCAAVTAGLPEAITGTKAKQEAEKQAKLEEEKQRKEYWRQAYEAAAAKTSATQSEYALKNGEPAVFRKCLNPNGCGDYFLLVPQNFNPDREPKLLYGQRAISHKDIEELEVKVAKKVQGLGDFLVLEDMRKIQIKCSTYTSYSDGGGTVAQGGLEERCQHVTLSKIEELKKMIGKTMWVPAPVMVGDFRLSPAHTLKIVDISTDITRSYSDDYNYIVKVDNKDTLYIPVRTETVSENPIKQSWGSEVINSIKKGTVFTGMTKEQALLSWGKPNQVNKTITNNLEYEQWVYRKGDFRADYLYFYNNKLETIQKF